MPQFLLDFRSLRAFNPRTFSERRSFRPAARPLRPEANARQRDAPSGAKVFGLVSSPAKAGDPVTGSVRVNARSRRTGYPAFAGYDGESMQRPQGQQKDNGIVRQSVGKA